ncbi:hypothetical protein EDB83DRAFT_2676925 [Lactarius deliciosus]|nr:hypothetical protein EDB83DRAFT_2676925 [Lactarius deliciosus]
MISMRDRSPQDHHISSARYWSDAVQTRLELVDNLLQWVPPSTLDDAATLRLVDREMFAIVAGPLGVIAKRRNKLTRTCRIPPEVLGQIFLHYQRTSLGLCIQALHKEMSKYSALYSTALWWVPAVAHVCHHWRTVAFQVPQLWSNIALHLGSDCALRMLKLSRETPITVALSDPHPCEASIKPVSWGRLPKPGPPKLDPHEVLAGHLFHIRELELGACSCTARRWVSLLETAAPHLETLWLCVNPHRPGSLPNVALALPQNFLATHPRLRRVVLENALLSSWAPSPSPLSHLVVLIVTAPVLICPSSLMAFTIPTHEQILRCLLLMPALEELSLAHCLPPFTPTFSLRTVSLRRLRALTLQDRSDRCHQMLHSLKIPATALVKMVSSYASALSSLDFLRVLPLLSAHLSRNGAAIPTGKGSSKGGSGALSLSSTYEGGRTLFFLSVWRTFTPPTAAEARAQYFGPKTTPDVRLVCKWGSGNSDMEHRALLQTCAGVPLANLRTLCIRAEAALWSTHDWYDTFVACPRITNVSAYGASGEQLLFALELYAGSGPSSYLAPLFPELASLTLVGVDFVHASEAAWKMLSGALFWREASPSCVTILDRIELRRCIVKEDMINSLKRSAAIVVWDMITDPKN